MHKQFEFNEQHANTNIKDVWRYKTGENQNEISVLKN